MDVMSAALSGLRDAQNKLEYSSERISASSAAAAAAPDSVDLSTEMVNMLAAKTQFEANARVFHAADEIERKLLDLFA